MGGDNKPRRLWNQNANAEQPKKNAFISKGWRRQLPTPGDASIAWRGPGTAQRARAKSPRSQRAEQAARQGGRYSARRLAGENKRQKDRRDRGAGGCGTPTATAPALVSSARTGDREAKRVSSPWSHRTAGAELGRQGAAEPQSGTELNDAFPDEPIPGGSIDTRAWRRRWGRGMQRTPGKVNTVEIRSCTTPAHLGCRTWGFMDQPGVLLKRGARRKDGGGRHGYTP